MSVVITGVFDTYADALKAVKSLEDIGVDHNDISIVANDASHRDDLEKTHAGEDAGIGAGIGAAAGSVGGLLAGLGVIAIPGVGPVVAAGWLAATLAGAVGVGAMGAAAGGLVGAFVKDGVAEDDANVYAETIRRGGAVVSAKVHDRQLDAARPILSSMHAENLAARRQRFQAQGWTRFDPDATEYVPDRRTSRM